jgi:hypothetical protein
MTGRLSEARVVSLDAGCPALPLVEGEGRAVALIWPGMGAALRSLHRIELAAGAATVPQRHPMEAVYYVERGSGTVLDPDGAGRDAIAEGAMVHIEPGTAYRFVAGPDGLVLLGGPCPPDPALYAQLGGA